MASVSSGIRRKVDDLGRVVIPAGIRRSLDIREGDAVEVSVDGERVVLAKPRDACVFCGREGDDLERFRARLVCRECVMSIGQVAQRSADPPTPGQQRPTGPFEPTRSRSADAPPTSTAPPAPAADAAGPSTSPSEPDEPAWPTGPIDGDEFARQLARRSGAAAGPATSDAGAGATASDVAEQDADRIDDAGPADRSDRRPPYDPASTTAW